jgi:hypothetical protein
MAEAPRLQPTPGCPSLSQPRDGCRAGGRARPPGPSILQFKWQHRTVWPVSHWPQDILPGEDAGRSLGARGWRWLSGTCALSLIPSSSVLGAAADPSIPLWCPFGAARGDSFLSTPGGWREELLSQPPMPGETLYSRHSFGHLLM